jgi:hypothetical protein
LLKAISDEDAMETEEQMIERVGRQMFGDNIVFTPQVMEMAKKLFRKYLADMESDKGAAA